MPEEINEILNSDEIKAAILHSWQQSSGDLASEAPDVFREILEELACDLYDYLMENLSIWCVSGLGSTHIETFKEHMISQFTKERGDLYQFFQQRHIEILMVVEDHNPKYIQPFHITMGLCQFLQRMVSALLSRKFGITG